MYMQITRQTNSLLNLWTWNLVVSPPTHFPPSFPLSLSLSLSLYLRKKSGDIWAISWSCTTLHHLVAHDCGHHFQRLHTLYYPPMIISVAFLLTCIEPEHSKIVLVHAHFSLSTCHPSYTSIWAYATRDFGYQTPLCSSFYVEKIGESGNEARFLLLHWSIQHSKNSNHFYYQATCTYTKIHMYMYKDHVIVTWPTNLLAVDEDVGALEVSVEKSLRMTVVERLNQLTCQALDVELRELNHAGLKKTTQVMITVFKD